MAALAQRGVAVGVGRSGLQPHILFVDDPESFSGGAQQPPLMATPLLSLTPASCLAFQTNYPPHVLVSGPALGD